MLRFVHIAVRILVAFLLLGHGIAPAGAAVIRIAVGYDHTCILLSNGAVRCWGGNDYGQLGYGDTDSRGRAETQGPPADVHLSEGAQDLAAGYGHTCVVLQGGNVQCWGYNGYGQLGIGNRENIGDQPGEMPPPKVKLGEGAETLALTSSASCALLRSKRVVCWGAPFRGVLGNGNHQRAVGLSPRDMPPQPLSLGGEVQQLVAGADHVCVLIKRSGVRCWGLGYHGQLGYESMASIGDDSKEMPPPFVNLGSTQAQHIFAGALHTCVVTEDANLYCFGLNNGGQLGIGDLMDHGNLPGSMPPLAVPFGESEVVSGSGGLHTCITLLNGMIRCWGWNTHGQCGYGDTIARGGLDGQLPVDDVDLDGFAIQYAASPNHFGCALLAENSNCTVRCWGNNDRGQLGVHSNKTMIGSAPGDMPPALTVIGECEDLMPLSLAGAKPATSTSQGSATAITTTSATTGPYLSGTTGGFDDATPFQDE